MRRKRRRLSRIGHRRNCVTPVSEDGFVVVVMELDDHRFVDRLDLGL